MLLCFLLAVVSPTKSDLSRLHNCITSGCLGNQCFKVGKGHGNANDYGRVENPAKRSSVSVLRVHLQSPRKFSWF